MQWSDFEKPGHKNHSWGCFSILADESTDIAGIEQMSLCVRYVDENMSTIQETFLQFVPLYDVTGKGIATSLKIKMSLKTATLEHFHIDLTTLQF